MNRRRLLFAGIGLLALTAAAASVSIHRPRTLTVTDASDTPLDPVYIAYSYIGSKLNPVHAVTYEAQALALARTDRPGRITLPTTVHVHAPFPIEAHTRLFVEVVYVPRLHNAVTRMDENGRAVMEDFGERPQDWERSLHSLSSLLQELMSQVNGRPPLRERDPKTATLARELVTAFRDEYQAFLAQYEHVARVRPEMPLHVTVSTPQEQSEWIAAMDADLARQPTWGPLVSGFFADDVERFIRWASELP